MCVNDPYQSLAWTRMCTFIYVKSVLCNGGWWLLICTNMSSIRKETSLYCEWSPRWADYTVILLLFTFFKQKGKKIWCLKICLLPKNKNFLFSFFFVWKKGPELYWEEQTVTYRSDRLPDLCAKENSTFSEVRVFCGPAPRHLGSVQSERRGRTDGGLHSVRVGWMRVWEFTSLYFCNFPLNTHTTVQRFGIFPFDFSYWILY